MNENRPEVRRGVVRPIECLNDGWLLIREKYWLFLGISLVATLLAGFVPMGILLGPMMCGTYLCLFNHSRGEKFSFEMLFKGFDYFVPSLIATLIMLLPMIIVTVPAYGVFMIAVFAPLFQQPGAPPDPAMLTNIMIAYGVLILVLLIVHVVVTVLFFFIYPLIVDRKLSGTQAVAASLRGARANFGGVLGLVLVTMLLELAGSLVCCVGAYFILPIHFAAVAVAYERVFGKAAEPEPPPQGDVTLEPVSH